MSVCCSVDYYGSCINSPREDRKQYDLSCPNIAKNGELNFWQSQCIQRIGNPDIKCCYRGCKEAAKYPELKAKMDKVETEWNAAKQAREARIQQTNETIRRTKYARRAAGAKRKPTLPKEIRAEIINMYTSGLTIRESVNQLNCKRSIISLYRKLFREGAMDANGNMHLE